MSPSRRVVCALWHVGLVATVHTVCVARLSVCVFTRRVRLHVPHCVYNDIPTDAHTSTNNSD